MSNRRGHNIYLYIYIAWLIYSSNNGARERENKPQVLRRESSALVNTVAREHRETRRV